ncbi:MAG: hypothetical protein IJV00_01370 [Clostridia bacterium]|nr:hypothetical protein [Clostridia bacterium]
MKKRIVLSIGTGVIVLTLAAAAAGFISDLNSKLYDQIDRKLIVPVYIFMVLPVVLEEISLLRCVYKLVFKDPGRAGKICCAAAAGITVCALAFQLLYFTRVITKDIFPEGPRAASSRLIETVLLSEWPVVIISFILGSVNGKIKT